MVQTQRLVVSWVTVREINFKLIFSEEIDANLSIMSLVYTFLRILENKIKVIFLYGKQTNVNLLIQIKSFHFSMWSLYNK